MLSMLASPITTRIPPAYFYPRILVGAGLAMSDMFAYKHNITHVINCAFDQDSPLWFRTKYPSRYVCLEAYDSPVHNILDWYPKFEATMHRFLQQGNGTVYVHCQAGMNRSAFLALTYVCKNFGLDMDATIKATLLQRPIMFQNPIFMNQVKEFISTHGHLSHSQNSGRSDERNNGDIGLRTPGRHSEPQRFDPTARGLAAGAREFEKRFI
jgi:protein-tyrosine phosphatase